MVKSWDEKIRDLAYDFHKGLAAEPIIMEVERHEGLSDEQKYMEAWRKLMVVI